jgi:hypothetical protein
VAAAFRRGVDTAGMPQVARMVPEPWVSTDERLRWLGGVDGPRASALAARMDAWTGRPTAVLWPSR